MTNPFFSVIIPALNEEKYLPHLLADLSAQSYHDYEVIVVDGQSEDKTIVEAKKFSKVLPKLTLLTSTRRHVCTQRNLGAAKAKGEYLVFMDADNRLPTYFLQGLKYKLESSPSQIATTFAYTSSDNPSETSIINTINAATELSRNMDTPLYLEGMSIITKVLFNQIGGFDESIDFSEGTKFILAAKALGHKHSVYHDPRYEFSLRRIRKYGAIKLVANIGLHQLSKLMGEELPRATVRELYPMQGGSLFKSPAPSRTKQFTKAVDKLLKNLSIGDKPLTLKVLKKQLDSLLS